MNTINDTNFKFPKQVSAYKGKVREVYNLDNELLVMVASDRLSAFDVIMPRQIPYKGQILNQIASYMLEETRDIVPNWLIACPDPNVAIGYLASPFKVEMVIRAYLTGHAWREYRDGKRMLCGVRMPDGMKENDKFPQPIITPSTKADNGMHDEDISREEIIKKGIVSEKDYLILEDYTKKLFKKGTDIAIKKDLLLVDTKYEFGKKHTGEIILIDEIHTPDSSRYFYAEKYQERQNKNEAQKQLSKEFVRQWLIANEFQGLEGQIIPIMTDEKVSEISDRYIELYENITGKKFIKANTDNMEERIDKNVKDFLKELEG